MQNAISAATVASRPPPCEVDIRAQLQRMLGNASFRPSQRRRDMLCFIVDETLAGRGNRLKGFTIAISVFGRDETFDQQSDPVVRLEARRLRGDLDSYYIDAGSQDPVRITIPKGSYLPHFAWQTDEAPAPLTLPEPDAPVTGPAATPEAEEDTKPARWRTRPILAATLVSLCGLMLVAAFFGLRGAGSDVAQARTPAIIVLPFEAFGDVDDIDLIAAGVTEELIGNLMLFRDFRVYSKSSSFSLDTDADPQNLARELGVSFVVSGVMQAQNNQVHLRARLIDAQSGEVRWSGSYDQPLTAGDLLGAQRDLAVAISTELGEPYGAVNEAIGQRMITDSTPSMPSYACILRAYDYRRSFDKSLFPPAIDCLKKAVIRDPDYADAWAMLGWLHLDAARRDFVPASDHPAEMIAAYDAASHAIKLEPRNPRALAALSVITFYQGDYAASEALQRRVLALNPYDPDTLAQLGWRMAVRGNREGLEYLEQAIARSANPPGWYNNLIAIYAFMDGDYARALDLAEVSGTSGSAVGVSIAAMSHAKLGDMVAARDALDAMAKTWPLLARDPEAAYRMHHPTDEIVAALVNGLLEAGWTPPAETPQ